VLSVRLHDSGGLFIPEKGQADGSSKWGQCGPLVNSVSTIVPTRQTIPTANSATLTTRLTRPSGTSSICLAALLDGKRHIVRSAHNVFSKGR
jgi:hypothetical protein